MENNQLQVIELPTELMELKKSTELKTAINVDDILFQFAPFFKQISEVKKDIDKVNFENPSELDMSIADTIRKRLVKIRTASEREKTEMNKDYILVQKIVTGANNMVSSICKLDENRLDEIAKFLQIKEAKRLSALLEERTQILSEYGFTKDDCLEMEKLNDEMWETFLLGVKKNHADKIEAERIAEEKRLEAIRLEAEERENQRIEMERLRKENEEKELQIKAEREKAEKEAAELKAKADAELAEQKRLADIEAKKQSEIIAKQKEEADKLAAELKAKADAELKEKQRIDAENKAKLEAEKKAAKAPDKVKLKAFIDSIPKIEITKISMDSISVAQDIQTKLEGFKKWANEQINTL